MHPLTRAVRDDAPNRKGRRMRGIDAAAGGTSRKLNAGADGYREPRCMRKGIYCRELRCAGSASRVKHTFWGKIRNFRSETRQTDSRHMGRRAGACQARRRAAQRRKSALAIKSHRNALAHQPLAQRSKDFSTKSLCRGRKSSLVTTSEAIKPETKPKDQSENTSLPGFVPALPKP